MKLFTVIGMHRSGTSIVSRGLNLLGAHLGPDDDLMPAKPDNPAGFWETLTVAQLHDDLFAHLGGRWDAPPVLEDGWESSAYLDAFAERIRGIVDSHFSTAKVAVWKDPRGSLFLPLWRRVVPIAGTVLCVRSPDEVARSLSAREGFDPERAAALWLRYVVSAYRDAGGALVVRFEEPYADPDGTLARLADFSGLPAPGAVVLEDFRNYVNAELRHFTEPAHRPGRLMRLARAAHALLLEGRREVVSPFFEALTDAWRLDAQVGASAHLLSELKARLGPSVVERLGTPS